jgi:hypothetical protein
LGLEKPNSGLDPVETFFPNSGSDLDSDETFQISRNLGLDIDEIVCLLDSQLCSLPNAAACRLNLNSGENLELGTGLSHIRLPHPVPGHHGFLRPILKED